MCLPPDSLVSLYGISKKKSVRAVPVARSARRGLRIAQTCRSLTQNMSKDTNGVRSRACRWRNIHISTEHLPFATFLTNSESCEVSTSQERAPIHAFLYVCRPTHITLDRGFCKAVCNCKFNNKKLKYLLIYVVFCQTCCKTYILQVWVLHSSIEYS